MPNCSIHSSQFGYSNHCQAREAKNQQHALVQKKNILDQSQTHEITHFFIMSKLQITLSKSLHLKDHSAVTLKRYQLVKYHMQIAYTDNLNFQISQMDNLRFKYHIQRTLFSYFLVVSHMREQRPKISSKHQILNTKIMANPTS